MQTGSLYLQQGSGSQGRHLSALLPEAPIKTTHTLEGVWATATATRHAESTQAQHGSQPQQALRCCGPHDSSRTSSTHRQIVSHSIPLKPKALSPSTATTFLQRAGWQFQTVHTQRRGCSCCCECLTSQPAPCVVPVQPISGAVQPVRLTRIRQTPQQPTAGHGARGTGHGAQGTESQPTCLVTQQLRRWHSPGRRPWSPKCRHPGGCEAQPPVPAAPCSRGQGCKPAVQPSWGGRLGQRAWQNVWCDSVLATASPHAPTDPVIRRSCRS